MIRRATWPTLFIVAAVLAVTVGWEVGRLAMLKLEWGGVPPWL